MLAPRGTIAKEGDVVLVVHGHQSLTPLVLQGGAVLHCKAGKFDHDDIIGRPLGTHVRGRSNVKGDLREPSVLILQNSADMWTQAVPHRTQIIYDTDIAVILLQLRLGPGKRVVEAGTGSGSLTHSLAKAVAPDGCVYTCDFHKQRCLEARAELRRNGLGPHLVCSQWRDVCTTNTGAVDVVDGVDPDVAAMDSPRTGFGVPAASVDAIFLDVPAPWAAVENVCHALKDGGVLCTFSPCMEQTQRTAEALRAAPHPFVDIRTVEALTKYFDPVYKRARDARDHDCVKFRAGLVSKGHSAYLTFARRRLCRLPQVDEAERQESGAVAPDASGQHGDVSVE
ncbi:Methyltransferase domain containing protein [Novymonas esmeraldas]|uniref:tRNA (adenine(58)-N(1))-methyltransferase n=1 Tax=Novymonas esmeraldas TaxID=1808958 RepID=A0AAW0ENQ4_9TRYP